MKSIAVIIPLYNKGRTVARCIDSVLAQTVMPDAIVVVNDGSTDNGPDVVRRYSDKGVRLVDQANSGPGAARNRGMASVDTQFVAFLDADDWYEPEYLEHCLDLFATEASTTGPSPTEGPGLGAVCTSLRFVRDGQEVGRLHTVGPSESSGLGLADGAVEPLRVRRSVAGMSPCSTVMRRSLALSLGGFYEDGCRYGEDAWLMLRLMGLSRVRFSGRVLVNVDRSEAELSAKGATAHELEPLLRYREQALEGFGQRARLNAEAMLDLKAMERARALIGEGRRQEARQLLRSSVSGRASAQYALLWLAARGGFVTEALLLAKRRLKGAARRQ